MKRIKYLPSMLMLLLCIGVLSVGIYAVQPNTNIIDGTISIETFSVVDVKVEVSGAKTGNFVGDWVTVDGTTSFNLGALVFNTDVDKIEDVEDVVVSFSIKNLAEASTNQEIADNAIGVFFADKTTSIDAKSRAIAANVKVEDEIKTGELTNVSVDLTSYTCILPQQTTNMYITFTLKSFEELQATLFNYKLCVEEYVPETTSDGLVKLPVVSTTTATLSVAGLSSVALASDPELYTTVGVNDIQNKSSIQYVAMPSAITKIGNGVFQSATNLKSVAFSKNLQTIGDYAFYGCSSLSKINIPDGLLELGRYSFGNAAITQVVLPNTLTRLGDYAFNGCNITSINYDPADENLRYLGNETNPYLVLYDYVGNNSDTININSQTRFLYSECLKWQFLLKSITLPSGLIEIGSYAFEDSAITEINIPEGVTRIGEYAFSSCDLVTVVLPNTLKIIDQYAFTFCSSLNQINIPEGVTTIGQNAFSNCIALTSITIPDSVTSLGNSAFFGCSNLTNLSIGSGVQDTINNKFANCSSITNLTLGYSNITSDYVSAFPNITSLTLKDSVKTIGDSAFEGCTSLASVDLGNGVETIGNNAFAGTALTEISIPASVTLIEDKAFNCANLLRVNIEDLTAWCGIRFAGADGTGTSSYANPTLYTEVNKSKSGYGLYIGGWDNGPVTEIRIPRTVTSLKQYVFVRCANLTAIYIPKEVTSAETLLFLNSAETMHIYCEAESKPSGWNRNWHQRNGSQFYETTLGQVHYSSVLDY